MTLFARYYSSAKKPIEVSMTDIENLIKEEKNKSTISDHIYHRYYDRFLKPFDYKPNDENVYNKEYKSGFAIMTCCLLVIESLSTYFQGENKSSKKSGDDIYKSVFEVAKFYNPNLTVFASHNIYANVRNGLLHQGETYGKFLIKRSGSLFDKNTNAINATKFLNELKLFLSAYTNDLKIKEWNGELWDNCRVKIRHIVRNSR